MTAVRTILAVVILGVLALAASAEDKKADNAKLVVGIWEVVKADAESLPVGAVVEMTKDGKVKVSIKDEKHEGTYKVDGDKIVATIKGDNGDEKHTVTIKKISDTEMVTEHDGKTCEFKKKTKGS